MKRKVSNPSLLPPQLSQERLERRVDELNRMLLSEQHRNRKDKLAVAKLQQEVARQKSERSLVCSVVLFCAVVEEFAIVSLVEFTILIGSSLEEGVGY